MTKKRIFIMQICILALTWWWIAIIRESLDGPGFSDWTTSLFSGFPNGFYAPADASGPFFLRKSWISWLVIVMGSSLIAGGIFFHQFKRGKAVGSLKLHVIVFGCSFMVVSGAVNAVSALNGLSRYQGPYMVLPSEERSARVNNMQSTVSWSLLVKAAVEASRAHESGAEAIKKRYRYQNRVQGSDILIAESGLWATSIKFDGSTLSFSMNGANGRDCLRFLWVASSGLGKMWASGQDYEDGEAFPRHVGMVEWTVLPKDDGGRDVLSGVKRMRMEPRAQFEGDPFKVCSTENGSLDGALDMKVSLRMRGG